MGFRVCKDCNDTGKIQLFTSVVTCDCVGEIGSTSYDYADEIAAVNRIWDDACCSCHVSPPCGFCLRYAEAGLDDPEYCNICGDPSPSEGPRLCSCEEKTP